MIMNFMKIGLMAMIIILAIAGAVWYKKYYAQEAVNGEPTWTVTIDKNRPKESHDYDVIVIGGGLGGLTSAALLAKERYKVLVLEQSHRVGGYAQRIDFDGFAAFYGAEDISGAWPGGSVHYLVRQLGYNPENLFRPVKRRLVLEGLNIDIQAGPNQFEHMLVQLFPADERAIHAFFEDARSTLQEIFDPSLVEKYGIPLTKNALQKIFSPLELRAYNQKIVHKVDWLNKTFQQKIDQYFINPKITRLLCSLLGYIGGSRSMPALFALVGTLTYFINGSHYMHGGPQALADLLSSSISQHGGTVLCNMKVEQVMVDHGKVTGVWANNQEFKAPVVISNINAKTLYTQLINKHELSEGFLTTMNNIKMGASSMMINLGVNLDLSELPTFIKDLDLGIHLIIRTSSDQSLAPKGHASVSILYKGDYEKFPKPESPEYESYVAKIADEAIEKAELVIPHLRLHIVARNIVTPYTFERTFLMPEGANYCFDARTDKPFLQKSSIKGLYLASASAKMGGVEAVVMSGIWVRNDSIGWKELSKRENLVSHTENS